MKKRKLKFQEQDFDINSLPNSRKSQFRDIFRLHWRDLIFIGLSLFVSSLLFIALFIFKDIFLETYRSTYEVSDTMSQAQVDFYVTRMSVILDVLKIPCFVVFSLGLAGVSRVLRCLIFNEGYFYINDFFKGIKQNGKHYALTAFIFSFLMYVCEWLFIAIYNMTLDSGHAMFVALFPLMIVVLILGPIAIFLLNQVPIYTLKYRQYLVNGAKYSLGKYAVALGFVCIPLFFYVTINILGINAILLSVILLVLIGILMPLYLLMVHLYCVSIFDKYLNSKSKNNIYLKGLYQYYLNAQNENKNE